MVDEEDELLRLSDEDENGSQVETNTNIDDVTAFIDSYCNDEADTTVVPAAEKKDEGADNAKAKPEAKPNTSINFEPPASSTPSRPSTSSVATSVLPPILEDEEEDYSILYEGMEGLDELDQDQEYQTLHLDQLNDDLDFSLLYDGEDNDTITEENQTVVAAEKTPDEK